MVDDRWQIRRYSNFIQSCRVVLILRQISHIYPGKGSLFLLPVRGIHRPSMPLHRSSYASSKAPCPNTATPPSSAVHPSLVHPFPHHGPMVTDRAIDTATSGSEQVLSFIQISWVQRMCSTGMPSPSAISVQWWRGWGQCIRRVRSGRVLARKEPDDPWDWPLVNQARV
jgi:hypothetical protein